MANGRAAVSTTRRSAGSGWYTAALVVGMNLVAAILIWSVWQGTGLADLGPAAVLGVIVGAALFVVGVLRAWLDSRAARRDVVKRRRRAPGALRFRPQPVVRPVRPAVVFEPAAFAPAERRRPTVTMTGGEPMSRRAGDRAADAPVAATLPAPTALTARTAPTTATPGVDRPASIERVESSRSLEPPPAPPPAQLPPAPSRPLAELHGLGATMQARMFDHGLMSQEDVAAVGDDEIEDLAADLGTFPGRLAEWVAEARANLAAADPYVRSA